MAKQVRIRKGLYAVQQHQKPSQLLPNESVEVANLSGVLRSSVSRTDPAAAVVGSSLDVANGTATHDSINSAIASIATTGGKIYVSTGTFTESITLSQSNIMIVGQGAATTITGSVTISGNKNAMTGISFGGSVSIIGNYNTIQTAWASPTTVVSITGTDNSYEIIQES